MSKHNGFSLIELMLYITITTLVMVMLLPWSAQIIVQYHRQHCIMDNNADALVAYDRLMKDILATSSRVETWYVSPNGERIAYKCNDTTWCGWECKGTTLVRKTGLFSPLTATWKSTRAIPLCSHVTECVGSVAHKNGKVSLVTVTVRSGAHTTFSIQGAPRNAYE